MPDGGADAAADAASDAAAPSGCEDFVPDGDRACVPAGRFWFGWIADDEVGNDFGCLPDGVLQYVNSCAHEIDLAAFEIDLREVSVGDYAAAVAAGAVPAPPELCESAGHIVQDSDCDLEFYGPTGFDATGQVIAESVEGPVVCVYKAEARAYCEWRGGRLPLSTEWMKAARGAAPSRREIPWADHVPLPFESWNDLPGWDQALGVDGGGEPVCEGLTGGRREPVTSRPENASPYGLLHALGNVREWVEVAPSGDLYEQGLVDVFGFGEPRESPLLSWGPRISVGLPAEHGVAGVFAPIQRDHTVGFRCAYDR